MMSTGATLKILREALDSWDATESDLAEAASIFMKPPSASVHSACTATQAVVDALIRIIEAEGQQRGIRGSATAAAPASARASALAFVAAFVTAGRATVQLQDAVPILECLAQVCNTLNFQASLKCQPDRQNLFPHVSSLQLCSQGGWGLKLLWCPCRMPGAAPRRRAAARSRALRRCC